MSSREATAIRGEGWGVLLRGVRALGIPVLILASACARPQVAAVQSVDVPLDPLSLQIPFADQIPCEDVVARWEELARIDSLHVAAFGLHKWYVPEMALTAGRCSPLENLPYESCLRIGGTAFVGDWRIEPGAVSILIVLDEGQGKAQLRVIDFGEPWSPIGDHFEQDDTSIPSLLGARAVLDTTVRFPGAQAAQLIAKAAELCGARAPMEYPDVRVLGPEAWTLEVRDDGVVCRGLEQALLAYHEVWNDLVLECLSLFGLTEETLRPLLYRSVDPYDSHPGFPIGSGRRGEVRSSVP